MHRTGDGPAMALPAATYAEPVTALPAATFADAPCCWISPVAQALESYFLPGNLTEEKYAATKMLEIMRMNAVGWTLLTLAQLTGIMMAPDLVVYGPMVVIFNLAFTGLFIYNISNAGTYGFAVPPALFFLFIVSSSNGAAAIGLLFI